MSLKHLSFDTVRNFLKPREKDAHKGSFGRVAVLGGDYGMPGAVKIAGEGALRVGAGLVHVITQPEHVVAVVSTRPELLCSGMQKVTSIEVKQALSSVDVIALGPGLGQSSWSEALYEMSIDYACERDIPLLIDADGLNWLVKKQSAWQVRDKCVFTPHPGEVARMLGISTADVQVNRIGAAKAIVERFGGIVVLKGAETLIATKDEDLQKCNEGNPAMASAGMGDLLTGIIAGLMAQGLTPWQAAQLGVVLHARAGDEAQEARQSYALLASDVLDELPKVLSRS